MNDDQNNQDNGRRNALKGLLGIPFAAGAVWGAIKHTQKQQLEKEYSQCTEH